MPRRRQERGVVGHAQDPCIQRVNVDVLQRGTERGLRKQTELLVNLATFRFRHLVLRGLCCPLVFLSCDGAGLRESRKSMDGVLALAV